MHSTWPVHLIFLKLNVVSFLLCANMIKFSLVKFEVVTAVVMESSTFWDITPCSPLKVNRRFREICRLHLQGRRISHERNKREAGNKQSNRKCIFPPASYVNPKSQQADCSAINKSISIEFSIKGTIQGAYSSYRWNINLRNPNTPIERISFSTSLLCECISCTTYE
jgi:hypothetical protein